MPLSAEKQTFKNVIFTPLQTRKNLEPKHTQTLSFAIFGHVVFLHQINLKFHQNSPKFPESYWYYPSVENQ